MFQRMVAIPQEEYLKLSSVQQVRQPLTQQFYNLEQQYGEHERIRDPYERLIMQSETLENMKELKERMRQDITLSTPKPYQSRALALYQSLLPFIKFNERGEIFNDAGDLVPESRLEDLIQFAVRDRRRSVVPAGWSQFRNLLKSQNVPRFMLNQDTLQEMTKADVKTEPIGIARIKEEKTSTSSSSNSSSFQLPRGRKRTRSRSLLVKGKRAKRAKAHSRVSSKRIKKENPRYGEKYGFMRQY